MQPSTTAAGLGPLSDIVIVDLTRVLAGPFATMALADLGARVIKVEPPSRGDDARHFGPFTGGDGDAAGGKSVYFESLNRGKQSIALDLKATDDRAVFEKLVAAADVLVENYRAGTMEKLNYGWEALRRINPQLIYAAVSGFGQTGPYRHLPAYDLVVQAMGGIMSITGALENAISRYLAAGKPPAPLGMRHPSITPFDGFKAKDAHLIIAAGNDALFSKLCAALGADDLPARDAFNSNDRRTENHAALKHEIENALANKTAAEWLEILRDAGVPCAPINDVAQVVEDAQVKARNMIIESRDANGNRTRMAGNPIKMSGCDDPSTRAPAPALDQHREEILRWLK